MFIEVEGIDKCGKNTQGERLAERMKAKLFQFPDRQTVMGKVINHLLRGNLWIDGNYLGDVHEGIEDATEGVNRAQAITLQGLMVANRLELATAIRDLVKAGTNVVALRYWASGYAYGRADGLSGEYLKNIHSTLIQPDLHILLDIDVATSFLRQSSGREHYEQSRERLNRASKAYRELWSDMASIAPKEWVIVDGRQDKDAIGTQMEQAIVEFRHSRS